jgi:hypothetical protein
VAIKHRRHQSDYSRRSITLLQGGSKYHEISGQYSFAAS